MGKWEPETLPQQIGYRVWSILGLVSLLAVYPMTVVGFAMRFYASKLDSTRTRIGVVGVTAIALVFWGGVTVVAHLQLPTEAVIPIAAASGVAVVSTALAATFSKVGGRLVSVVLAYPFAMTAIFLPPVVAALVTPSLEGAILEPSYDFAVWILDNVLFVGGINDYLRENFVLEGPAYAGMWVGISFPLGWFFGILIALANLVRPSG